VVRYGGIVRNYLAPQLGKWKLAQLQPQQVQAYQAGLLKRGFSPSSITLHRTVLGSALKQAVAFGLIPRNVVALVRPPREDRESSKGSTLTPQEAQCLLDAVRGDRLEAFYLVLLTAGLRRGEALGLRWADLELDECRAARSRCGNSSSGPVVNPTLVPVKSRKGARSIPLPSFTAEALRQRAAIQATERRAVGESAWRAPGLVFNSDDGAPLHRNTITKQFHSKLKAAGLRHLRLHDLRHTYGSLLMSQGVPLKTIAELMGHASIEVTADIYLHSLDVEVRETARSLEKALASPANGLATRCPTCGQLRPSMPAPSGQEP
jgi:integrase